MSVIRFVHRALQPMSGSHMPIVSPDIGSVTQDRSRSYQHIQKTIVRELDPELNGDSCRC
jgi:hypothetical protein